VLRLSAPVVFVCTSVVLTLVTAEYIILTEIVGYNVTKMVLDCKNATGQAISLVSLDSNELRLESVSESTSSEL
jgi:uncharacterized protein YbcI